MARFDPGAISAEDLPALVRRLNVILPRLTAVLDANEAATAARLNQVAGVAMAFGGDAGVDGDPGPPGSGGGGAGTPGADGATGAQGPMGPALSFLALDGEDGERGSPGPAGAAGAAGAAGSTGAQGPTGPALYFLAEDGEPGEIGPMGRTGATGPAGTGATGAQGPMGPALYFLAEDGEPGEAGPMGLTGAAGASVTAASQAEQEAAASTTVMVTPGLQHFHPSAAKCWVRATQSSTTIQQGYNIASVADTAAGRMTVTIATDFSGTTYCVLVGAEHNSASGTTQTYQIDAGSIAAGSFIMESWQTDGTEALTDPSASWMAVAYGDL